MNLTTKLLACLTITWCIVWTWVGQSFLAHNQYNDSDNSYFIYGGLTILNDLTLYKEFWDQKPPGIFIQNALLIKFFGLNFKLWAIVHGLCFLGCCSYLFKILQQKTTTTLALIGCIVFCYAFQLNQYIDFGNRPEFGLSLIDMIAFLYAWNHLENPRKRNLITIGFLSFCGFMYKPVGIATLLALSAYYLFLGFQLKRLLTIWLGFAIPFVLCLLYYSVIGLGGEPIFASLIMPMSLASESKESFSEILSWTFLKFGPMWCFLIPLLGIPLFLYHDKTKTSDKKYLILISLFLFASISGIIIQKRGSPHYFQQGVAGIVILNTFCTYLFTQTFNKQKFLRVIFILYAILCLIIIRWPITKQWSTYKQLSEYEASFIELKKLSHWLKPQLNQNDTFYYFANGYQPYILTSTQAPHKFTPYFVKLGELGAKLALDDLNQMKNKKPLFIVENIKVYEFMHQNSSSEAQNKWKETYLNWKDQDYKISETDFKSYKVYRLISTN